MEAPGRFGVKCTVNTGWLWRASTGCASPVKERKCGAAVLSVPCREVAEAVFVLEPPGLDPFTEGHVAIWIPDGWVTLGDERADLGKPPGVARRLEGRFCQWPPTASHRCPYVGPPRSAAPLRGKQGRRSTVGGTPRSRW